MLQTDKKSKIFFIVFFAAALTAAGISFYKYFILKDYYITAEAECDPETEKCFIYECNPEEDSECPEDPNERISYYKLVEKKAFAVSLCDSNSPDCQPFACQEGEDCKEILCDEKTAKTEGAECSNFEMFK